MSDTMNMGNIDPDEEALDFDLSNMPKEPLGFLDLIVYDYHLRRNHVSTASAFVVESQISRATYEKMMPNSSQSLLQYWFLTLFPFLVASMDQSSPANKAKNDFLKKLMFEAEDSSEDLSKNEYSNDMKRTQGQSYNEGNRETQSLSAQNSFHFQHSNQVTPSMNENRIDNFNKQFNRPMNTTLPPNAIPLKEWTNAPALQQTPSAKQTPQPLQNQQIQFNNGQNPDQAGKPGQAQKGPQSKKRGASANNNKVQSPSNMGQLAVSQAQQPVKQRRNTGQTPKQTPKQIPKQVKSIPPVQTQPVQRPNPPMVVGGNQPNPNLPQVPQMGMNQPNAQTPNQQQQQLNQVKVEGKDFVRPPQGALSFGGIGQGNSQMSMPNMTRMKSTHQLQGPGQYLATNNISMDANQLSYMIMNQKQMNLAMHQGGPPNAAHFNQAAIARGPAGAMNLNPSLGRPNPNGWNTNQANNLLQNQMQQQFMQQRFMNQLNQQPGQNPNFLMAAYGRGNPNPGMIPGNQPSSVPDQSKQAAPVNTQMTPKQPNPNPNPNSNPNQRPQPTLDFNGQMNSVAMQNNQMTNNMANQGSQMQGQVVKPNQGQNQNNMTNAPTSQQPNANASGPGQAQAPSENRTQTGPPFQQPPTSGSNPYQQMFLSFESLSGMNPDLGLDLNFGQASSQQSSAGFGNEVNPFASGINPFNLFVNDGINMGLIDQMNNQPFDMNLGQNNMFFQQNNNNNTNNNNNNSVSTPFTPQHQANQAVNQTNTNQNPQQSPFTFQPTLGSNNNTNNQRSGGSTSLVHSVLDHADELTNSLESIMGIDPFGNQSNERSTPRRT